MLFRGLRAIRRRTQGLRSGAMVAAAGAGLVFGVVHGGAVRAEPGAQFWKKPVRTTTTVHRTVTPTATPSVAAAGLTATAPSAACKASAVPYREAIVAHNARLQRYWQAIARKKKLRVRRRRGSLTIRRADYVLTHPASYKGPARPKCLDIGGPRIRPKSTLPLVRDFRAAAKSLYGFVPRPSSEWEYKLIYAREAVSLGLTASQVVGVYALETGGIGPYFRQSGIFPVDQNCKPITPRGRPASTALGYSQLLSANTSVMANEKGRAFAARLDAQARSAGPRRAAELRRKAAILRRMARDVKAGLRRYKNRNNWREYVAFGKTRRGYAVHALNLDLDIGPLIQVHKLKKIVDVAARRGFRNVLASELELMNLVGYGRGLEMMTRVARGVPTSNFFNRGGYYRNPVAKNRSAQGLLDKIAERIKVQLKKCGSREFLAAFRRASQ